MAERNLEIVISAVNKAQAELGKVQSELKGISTEMNNVKKSSEAQTASVFKGVAVYDLFRTAVRGAIGLLQSSIQESMETARIMAQVETNVRNAGFSFDELSPKIKQASENALKLGFDDDTAAESLSKLLLVTKDFEQAQALSNLAMDLARNKNVDLQTATRQVTLATQGNVKELKLLGIELDETATTAENLKSMQDQLKDSAVNFANTTAGQLAIMQEQWANTKQLIGDELAPIMGDFFVMVQENTPTIIALAEAFAGLAKAAGFVAKGVVGFGKVIATGVSAAVESGAKKVSWFTKVLNKVGLASDESVTKTENFAESWEETTKAAADDALNLFDKTQKVPVAMENVSKSLAKVKNAVKPATDEIKKMKDVLANASKEYQDFAKDADDSLFELRQSHKANMTDIRNEMQRVKSEMSSLRSQYAKDVEAINKSFAEQRVSDQMAIAQQIVANESKIAEIQTELAGEVSAERKAELETELSERQLAERMNADFIKSLSSEIAEVKRFNELSELDQAIETFNKKRAMAQQEFSERLSQIKGEFDARMSALKSELESLKEKEKNEKELYKEKKEFIKKLQEETAQSNLAFAKSAVALTEAQVKKEVAYYQQLAEAIRAARSANTAEFSRINKNISGIPKLASGGIVTRPTLAMIGEAGPEAVIPLSKMAGAGAGGVTINFSGNTFMGRESIAEKIGNDIVKVLKQQMRI